MTWLLRVVVTSAVGPRRGRCLAQRRTALALPRRTAQTRNIGTRWNTLHSAYASDQASPDIFTGSQLPAEGRRHIERSHDDLGIDASFNLAGIVFVAGSLFDRGSIAAECLFIPIALAIAPEPVLEQFTRRCTRHFVRAIRHQKLDSFHGYQDLLLAAHQWHCVLRRSNRI